MQAQVGTKRDTPRTRVKLVGRITCRKNSTSGTVVDLSDAGISFQLAFDIQAVPGQEVAIESEELGRLSGIVRWARGDKIGVRLQTSSNTAAQIASYYKFFR